MNPWAREKKPKICAPCARSHAARLGQLQLGAHPHGGRALAHHRPLEDGLHSELAQLMRGRGTSARRAAERIDPIEVVVGDAHGEPERIVGLVEPPEVHHGQLRDVEFATRKLEPGR
jgi:hypothetical protein